MRQSKILQISLVAVLCSTSFAPRGVGADKREILRAARQSYYNLPSQGFIEFQCSVIPDWTAILKNELKSDIPPDYPALKLLNQIHFWLSLDQKGSAKLTHQSDYTPTDQKSIENLRQTISGIEEVLSGFVHTISPFLFTSPFPEIDGEYEIEERQNQYWLSYREGRFGILTTMAKDFAVIEMKVVGPEFTGTIRPELRKTDRGFLVTAYRADYQPSSGSGSGQVSTQIDYEDVEGLQLPAKLHFDTTAGGSTHRV